MQRWLKYFSFILLGLSCLIVGLLLFTQTRLFKNWLRDKLVVQASDVLNRQLQIGRIDGNFVSYLQLNEILLESSGDTVVYLPKIKIDWTPSRLLRKEILVNSIVLDSPYLNLQQLPDSSWNVSKLVPAGELAKPDTVDQLQPLGWKVSIEDLHLKNGRLKIELLDTLSMFPGRIESINAHIAITYTDNCQKVRLREFRLQSVQPTFSLKEFSLMLTRQGDEIILQDLVLSTTQNRLQADVSLDASNGLSSTLKLRTGPIDFAEFRLVFPELQLYGHPEIALNANYNHDSLHFDFEINECDQRVHLTGDLAAIGARPRYSIHGNVEKLDLGRWLNDPEMATVINGNFHLKGSGTALEDASAKLRADFRKCLILQRPLEQLLVQGDYLQGDVSGNLTAWGNFGWVSVDANIDDVSGLQHFNIATELRHLNVADLTLEESLQTDINLVLTAQGSGLSSENILGNVQLRLASSALVGVTLDTFFANVNINNERYDIETLHVMSKPLQLNLSGEVSVDSLTDLQFEGQLGDLMALKSILQVDTVQATGSFAGKVRGKLDSLFVEANWLFEELLWDGVAADSVSGDLSFFWQQEGLQGHLKTHIKNAGAVGFEFDTIDLQTEFVNQRLHVSIDASKGDSLNGSVEALFAADSLQTYVAIPSIVLNFRNQQWTGGSDSMQIVLGDDTYDVRNFELLSGEQFFCADGTISMGGEEDFHLKAKGLNVGRLAFLAGIPVQAGGNLNFSLDIAGTAEAPIAAGKLAILDGQFNKFAYEGLQARFNYADERFTWDFALNLTKENKLTGDGYLPVNLSLNNEGVFLYNNRPVQLNLKTEGFPLSMIEAGTKRLKDIQGEIVCDLRLENTFKDSQMYGFLRVNDGRFNLTESGVKYDDIRMELSIDSTRVSITSFHVRSDKGTLTASGYANFDSSIVSGNIKTMQVKFTADDFLIASNKDYEMSIDGSAKLTGDMIQPQFDGSITVLRSRFFLPALAGESDNPDAENLLPLLVAAATKEDCTMAVRMKAPERKTSASEFYNKLRGTVKLEMPRNTWLRSPEMNVEISGSLDLVKSGANFEIFGQIRTMRGNYDLFGKRFEITSGLFTFEGGTEYNPEIALEAQHEFRAADREKKTLKLAVTGKALEPSLRFTLDDTEITGGDALSYLFFGRSVDELTRGQKSGLADETDNTDLAKDLAASLISAQITKALGSALNLDMLEIKAKQSWQEASFVVGKYITDDLFVSYQRAFGATNTDDVASKLITLEYEVTRFLFLQLLSGSATLSGYDIIFKFEH